MLFIILCSDPCNRQADIKITFTEIGLANNGTASISLSRAAQQGLE